MMEGIVIGMIFYIVGNGSGEGLYDDNAFYADADPCAVQAWADEWVRSLPDDKRDRFDDVDPSKVSMSEVLEAMPAEWNPRLAGSAASALFI